MSKKYKILKILKTFFYGCSKVKVDIIQNLNYLKKKGFVQFVISKKFKNCAIFDTFNRFRNAMKMKKSNEMVNEIYNFLRHNLRLVAIFKEKKKLCDVEEDQFQCKA